MMRALNIAREIRTLAPSAECLFYAKSQAAAALCDPGIQYFVEEDLKNYAHWPELLQHFSPDVVIFDTVMPKGLSKQVLPERCRYVFVMRKGLSAKDEAILLHPLLARTDLILIPHSLEDFGEDLPVHLQQKSAFVGPIIRPPDEAAQGRLKTKYGLKDEAFLLTSTIGGGGFEQAEAFFKKVFEIHRRLMKADTRLRHIVVLGPHFKAAPVALEGMDLCTLEPQLTDLIALSDVVIAEGGYNTVNEIRLTKTPAIFFPSGRSNDDQEARVRALEKKGLALVFSEGERLEKAVSGTCDLISDRSALEAMRLGYQGETFQTGNRPAAEKILSLCLSA